MLYYIFLLNCNSLCPFECTLNSFVARCNTNTFYLPQYILQDDEVKAQQLSIANISIS